MMQLVQVRHALALVLGTLAAFAAAPAGARAELPPANPPDDAALARAGIRIDWPFEQGYVSRQPGDVIRVAVRSRRRKVRVALTRISDPGGAPLEVVARRRLRRGAFRARLPQQWAVTYTLTLHAAGYRYRALIGTHECPQQGVERTELTVERTSVRRGETLPARLHNTGTTCLSFGAGFDWQRLRDGQWETVPNDRPVPAIGYGLYPGGVFDFSAYAWEELEPGPHRLLYVGATSPQIEILP